MPDYFSLWASFLSKPISYNLSKGTLSQKLPKCFNKKLSRKTFLEEEERAIKFWRCGSFVFLLYYNYYFYVLIVNFMINYGYA